MKHIFTLFIILLCIICLSSCLSNPVRQAVGQFDATISDKVSPPNSSEGNTNIGSSSIVSLEQQKVNLLLENERLKQEIQEKQRQIEENHKQIQVVQKQIELEKQRQLQAWANWIAGVALVLGVMAFVASLFVTAYPLLPRLLRYSGIALVALAAVSLVFSLLVPYLIPMAIGIVVIALGSGIYFWAKDRKSLKQVVEAVEQYKTEIPNYKHKFREIIDSDVDEVINCLRKNIKK